LLLSHDEIKLLDRDEQRAKGFVFVVCPVGSFLLAVYLQKSLYTAREGAEKRGKGIKCVATKIECEGQEGRGGNEEGSRIGLGCWKTGTG